jgi:hypothetical protein
LNLSQEHGTGDAALAVTATDVPGRRTKAQIIALANAVGIDTDTEGDIWGSTNGALLKFADALLDAHLAHRSQDAPMANERTDFERWALDEQVAYRDVQHGLCFYDAGSGAHQWIGWQARARFGAPAQGAEAQAERAAVPEGWKLALHAAVSAIYFDDSSDYKSALGAVVSNLDANLAGELLGSPKAAYDKACALLAAPVPAVAQEDERQAGRDLNNTPCPKCGRRTGVHTQEDWEECFGVKTPPDEEEEGEQVAPDDGMFSSDWKDGYSVGFQAAKKLSSPAAASSESVDTPELRRLLYTLSCTTGAENKEIERRIIAHIESLIAARVAGAQAAPTDLSKRLRAYAEGSPRFQQTLLPTRDLLAACDEIDRYYGGMMAWKQTAEKKDRDWYAERMDRINDRIAFRNSEAQAAPDAVRDGLEALLIERRIAITPEYEGGFHAAIYGEEEAPQSKGFGKKPSEAVSNAINSTPAGDSQPAVGAAGQEGGA